MSEVDSLIEELFPEKKAQVGNSTLTCEPLRRRSEWDDESDADEKRDEVSGADMRTPQGSHLPTASSSSAHHSTNVGAVAPNTSSAAHFFDDDSGADSEVGSSAAHQSTSREQVGSVEITGPSMSLSKPVFFPVPFPSLSVFKGSYTCVSRCYLTNLGASLPHGAAHPTVEDLRAIAENEQVMAKAAHAEVMLRKGAFYAAAVRLGNGCLDHHGDFTSDGGCPHIVCRQCNYMVVRLQNAQWLPDNHVNLYLTLRNYYPDWCRLASSTPVGVEGGAEASRSVLCTSPRAAAYCCQCSWMTVRSDKAVVETRLTDVTLTGSATDSEHPFATEFPLPLGEKRRPPLWVCHGHEQ